MTTLPNMSLALPVRGAPGSGQWGDTLDSDLGLLDAHDHTTGKGVKVPSAGININADISFSSLYAPTALHRVQFSSIAAAGLVGGNNKSLFVSDGTSGLSANELYWRNNTGTHVKLTAGNALNVAAFVGGIGGDYSAVSALEAFDDSGKQYTFKDGAGNWARLHSGTLRIAETGSTSANSVQFAAPAGLAITYAMTLPSALPSATEAMSMTPTGVIAVDGKHGPRTITIPIINEYTSNVIAAKFASTSGVNGILFQVPSIQVGSRITGAAARVRDNVTGPTLVSLSMWSQADAATTSIGSTGNSAGSGAFQTLTLSGLTTTVAANTNYFVGVFVASGSATCDVSAMSVTYDRP